jgi:DNA-binding XRE family transcriptional regulator
MVNYQAFYTPHPQNPHRLLIMQVIFPRRNFRLAAVLTGMSTSDAQTLNGRQVTAARNLLGWSREKLAAEAGVTKSVIGLCERGDNKQSEAITDAIRDALERAGVEFPDTETVQQKPTRSP